MTSSCTPGVTHKGTKKLMLQKVVLLKPTTHTSDYGPAGTNVVDTVFIHEHIAVESTSTFSSFRNTSE